MSMKNKIVQVRKKRAERLSFFVCVEKIAPRYMKYITFGLDLSCSNLHMYELFG